MRCLTASGSRVTSTPLTSAVPDVGLSSPHSMRIVVDLPAPLLPRKPKISPRRTSNDSPSTATNWPKRRDSCLTSIATTASSFGSAAERTRQPGLGQPRIGQRARAIELGLQHRRLRVEHLGVGGDAGVEPLAEDAMRFGGGADAFGGRGNRRPARIQLE